MHPARPVSVSLGQLLYEVMFSAQVVHIAITVEMASLRFFHIVYGRSFNASHIVDGREVESRDAL